MVSAIWRQLGCVVQSGCNRVFPEQVHVLHKEPGLRGMVAGLDHGERRTWTNVVLLDGTEGTGGRAAGSAAAREVLPGARACVLHVPLFRCGGMSSDGQGGVTKAVRLPDPLEMHVLICKL